MSQFVAAGPQVASLSTGPVSITLPSGVLEGHRLLMLLASRGDAERTWTYPGGWAQHAKFKLATASIGTIAVASKVAGASEAAPGMSIDIATGGWSGQIASFSGVDATTPMDVAPVVGAQASEGLTWEPPNLTTLTPNALVVSCVMVNDDSDLFLSIAQSFIARMSGAAYSTVTGSDHSVGMATKLQATPGLVTMCQWGQGINGPDRQTGITLALRPADAAPPVSQLSKLIDMDNRRFVRVIN